MANSSKRPGTVADCVLEEGAGNVVAQNLIGTIGRVSGAIGPDLTGEVILPFGEGSDAYYAYSADGEEAIPVNARVVVMDFVAPKTVYVTVLP